MTVHDARHHGDDDTETGGAMAVLGAFPNSPLTRAALDDEGTALVMGRDEEDYAAVMKMLNAGECTPDQANELLMGNRYDQLRQEADRDEDRLLAQLIAIGPSVRGGEDDQGVDGDIPARLSPRRGGKPLAPEQWSRRYDQCRRCHSTERPHLGHGFCARCYPHRDAFLADLDARAAAARAAAASPREFETEAGDYRLTVEGQLLLKTAQESWRTLNMDSINDLQRLALDLPRLLREIQGKACDDPSDA